MVCCGDQGEEHMTIIYYWCPLHRAYVQRTVPTELAFRLAGLA